MKLAYCEIIIIFYFQYIHCWGMDIISTNGWIYLLPMVARPKWIIAFLASVFPKASSCQYMLLIGSEEEERHIKCS